MNENTLEYYGFTNEDFPFPDENTAWEDADLIRNIYSLDNVDYYTIYQILRKYVKKSV